MRFGAGFICNIKVTIYFWIYFSGFITIRSSMKYLLPFLRIYFCAILLFVTHFVNAQDWEKVSKLVATYPNGASARAAFMFYGSAVSISGDYAVVGVPQDRLDASGNNSFQGAGAVYILHQEGGVWTPVKKLVAPVRGQFANFGFSVSIHQNEVVVGEPDHTSGVFAAGAAHLFRKDQGGVGNWGLVKTLTATVQNAGDRFGYAVDISGDHVVVGATGDDLDSLNLDFKDGAGAAFVFRRNNNGADNWAVAKKLVPTIRSANDGFGRSVAIDGDKIVVGATGETEDASEGNYRSYAGAAYVFEKDNGGPNDWGLTQKLTPSQRAENDWFGNSVDISGDRVIVGALFEDEDELGLNFVYDAGAAYIFTKGAESGGNWTQTKKLTGSRRNSESYFGESVAISGDYALAGSRGETMDALGLNPVYFAGASYIFEKDQGGADTWGIAARAVQSTRASEDNFGNAVALDGRNALIAAMGEGQDANESNTLSGAGAVFVYHRGDPLPVTLASFNVTRVESTVHLNWTTTAETNTAYFEIEKSSNAKNWTGIGTREAANESNALLHYEFQDMKPGSGNLYYRLKMVDRDGSFAYSGIRSLAISRDVELIAFPNPVVDKIYIRTTGFAAIKSVEMRNSFGKLVYQSPAVNGEGIPTRGLAGGLYQIKIETTDGTSIVRKVAVNR